jgi:hypothetical protein
MVNNLENGTGLDSKFKSFDISMFNHFLSGFDSIHQNSNTIVIASVWI